MSLHYTIRPWCLSCCWFCTLLNCSHSSRSTSLLNSQLLSDNMALGGPKMATQVFIKASAISSFFLDFTTAATLNRVAWSIMCKLWTFSIAFKSTATTLKSLDIENPTTGLSFGFLYLRHMSHCSSMLFISSISYLSCMLADCNNFFNFSELEWQNWCYFLFFAILFFLSLDLHDKLFLVKSTFSESSALSILSNNFCVQLIGTA